MNKMVKTSKGIYSINHCGGGGEYPKGVINECCIGYFIIQDDDTRYYFHQKDDIFAIMQAFKA